MANKTVDFFQTVCNMLGFLDFNVSGWGETSFGFDIYDRRLYVPFNIELTKSAFEEHSYIIHKFLTGCPELKKIYTEDNKYQVCEIISVLHELGHHNTIPDPVPKRFEIAYATEFNLVMYRSETAAVAYRRHSVEAAADNWGIEFANQNFDLILDLLAVWR